MSISATPVAASTRPRQIRKGATDERRPEATLVHDRPLAARPLAAAVVRGDHAGAAGDLAAPVWRLVQAGRRDPRLQRGLLRRLPRPGNRRDDRAVLVGLERRGDAQ